MQYRATIKWHGDEIFRNIEAKQRQRLERAVRVIRNDVIRSISTKAPPASSPGNPPHLRTGEVRRSIATEVTQTGINLVGRCGSARKAAKFDELGTVKMSARPFLMPSLVRNLVQIQKIIQGG